MQKDSNLIFHNNLNKRPTFRNRSADNKPEKGLSSFFEKIARNFMLMVDNSMINSSNIRGLDIRSKYQLYTIHEVEQKPDGQVKSTKVLLSCKRKTGLYYSEFLMNGVEPRNVENDMKENISIK